jgi:hypothetical protein
LPKTPTSPWKTPQSTSDSTRGRWGDLMSMTRKPPIHVPWIASLPQKARSVKNGLVESGHRPVVVGVPDRMEVAAPGVVPVPGLRRRRRRDQRERRQQQAQELTDQHSHDA